VGDATYCNESINFHLILQTLGAEDYRISFCF
jgi:hypothetical protein